MRVPRPRAPPPVLPCGAELKNTFCLAKDRHAFVSHHIGDLENAETLRSFTEGIEHFSRLFGITPQVVAYDLHPEYLSTKYALDLDGVDLVGVQHHHAHIASCLADNDVDGPVIGVAFDGTGYGTDGTIWAASSLSRPWRSSCAPATDPGAHAGRCGRGPPALAHGGQLRHRGRPRRTGLDVARRNAARWDAVVSMARREVNAQLTWSTAACSTPSPRFSASGTRSPTRVRPPSN